MARTIDRPRPTPSRCPVRSGPSRWKGSKRRSTTVAGTTGPVLTTSAARTDQLGADLIAVQPGQVSIEHGHVVVNGDRFVQAAWTIRGDIDGHALASQADGDRFRHLHVVLDNQHPH